MPIMDLRKKAQVTIPKELVEKLGLEEGDKLEITEHDGVLQIVPVAVYPRKYVDSLKSEIEKTKKELAEGKTPLFDNIDEAFRQLNS